MIHQLNLKNFKKHSNLTLAFPEGVTSIVGANAAGKSSTLKGILLALFGTSAAGSKDHLWKWGADGERSVGLQMTLPDWGLVVVTRTPSTAKITAADGRVLASGNTAVTKFIEEALGMLAKDLRTLCYSPQGEAQGLLTIGPTAMQQKVEGLAKVDVIDKVLDLASKDINKLTGKIEAFPRDLDVAQISKDLEAAQVALDFEKMELESVIRLKKGVLEQAEHALNTYHDAIANEKKKADLTNTLQKIATDLTKETHTLGGINAELESLGEPLSPEAAGKLGDEIVKLVEKEEILHHNVMVAEKRQSEITYLKKDISELLCVVEKHDKATAKVEAAKQAVTDQEDITQLAQDKVAELRISTTGLKRLLADATCPACKQDLKDINKADIQKQLDEANLSFTKAYDVLDQHQTLLKEYKTTLASISKDINYTAAESLQTKAAKLQTLESQNTPSDTIGVQDELEAVKKILAEKRASYKTVVDICNRHKYLSERKAYVAEQYNKISADSVSTNEALASIPVVDMAGIARDTLAKNEAAKELLDRERTIQANIQIAKAKVESLVVEHAKAQRQQLELAKLATEKADTESLQTYLRKNRNRISADIWNGLLNLSSALISNTTEGALSNLTRSSSGEFTVEEEGRTVPVTESSGAQRSIIGTALRAAMTKTFYGDNLCLLLDEVTSDASDETAAAITGMLASLNMQVVTVSHRTGESVNAGNIVEIS